MYIFMYVCERERESKKIFSIKDASISWWTNVALVLIVCRLKGQNDNTNKNSYEWETYLVLEYTKIMMN